MTPCFCAAAHAVPRRPPATYARPASARAHCHFLVCCRPSVFARPALTACSDDRVRLIGNVNYGTDISLEELRKHYECALRRHPRVWQCVRGCLLSRAACVACSPTNPCPSPQTHTRAAVTLDHVSRALQRGCIRLRRRGRPDAWYRGRVYPFACAWHVHALRAHIAPRCSPGLARPFKTTAALVSIRRRHNCWRACCPGFRGLASPCLPCVETGGSCTALLHRTNNRIVSLCRHALAARQVQWAAESCTPRFR